jgi:hypothetical protein
MTSWKKKEKTLLTHNQYKLIIWLFIFILHYKMYTLVVSSLKQCSIPNIDDIESSLTQNREVLNKQCEIEPKVSPNWKTLDSTS